MGVILARRRAELHGGHAPPIVHAFPIPDHDKPPDALVAPCGAVLATADAERVQSFTGAPCTVCWTLAMAASHERPAIESYSTPPLPAPSARQTQQRTMESAPQVVFVVSTATVAGFAPSWRGREVHRVAAGAAMTELDGGTLVMGLCGGLGWGPVETAPESWPMCTECEEIDDADDADK